MIKAGNNSEVSEVKAAKEWRVFIGSSSNEEPKKVMEEIALAIERVIIPDNKFIARKWPDCFPAGGYTLGSLVDTAKEVDLAVFIYAEDDELVNPDGNNQSVTKPNVVFEHGLFMGTFGSKEKAIAVTIGNVIKQSDIWGTNPIVYEKDKKRGFKQKLTEWLQKRVADEVGLVNHNISASIVETNSENDNRDYEFALLYSDAKEGDEICVMGMGVTSFLNNEERITPLLNKKVKVHVLLMNEKVLRDDWICRFENMIKSISLGNRHIQSNAKCPVNLANIIIDKKHFGEYQQKETGYISDMKTAFNHCKEYKNRYKNIFDYSCFCSFIPMSMTAIKGKKMIVEYIIPFTKNRILIKVSYNQDTVIFDTFMDFYKSVEEKSVLSSRAQSTLNKMILQNNKQ